MSNKFFKHTMPLIKPHLHNAVCPKCPVPHPTVPSSKGFPTTQKTRNWAHGFWGPKGSLFYQQLQYCSKRQAALLCNSLARMNRFRHRPRECQWKCWEEARLIPEGVPLGPGPHESSVFSFQPLNVLLECLSEPRWGAGRRRMGNAGRAGWLIPVAPTQGPSKILGVPPHFLTLLTSQRLIVS